MILSEAVDASALALPEFVVETLARDASSVVLLLLWLGDAAARRGGERIGAGVVGGALPAATRYLSAVLD